MRRREFITLLGGSTIAWALAARAELSAPIRRIGVLMSGKAEDKEAKNALAAFLEGLQQAGWIDGRNLRIELRLGAGRAQDPVAHPEGGGEGAADDGQDGDRHQQLDECRAALRPMGAPSQFHLL